MKKMFLKTLVLIFYGCNFESSDCDIEKGFNINFPSDIEVIKCQKDIYDDSFHFKFQDNTQFREFVTKYSFKEYKSEYSRTKFEHEFLLEVELERLLELDIQKIDIKKTLYYCERGTDKFSIRCIANENTNEIYGIVDF